MKIQLIHAGGGSKLSSSGILPPTGIIQVGTYLKQHNPNLDVEVIDGELNNNRIMPDADIVGFSVTGANYLEAKKLAKIAKENGSNVVMGGSHASIKHKEILRNNEFIDAVVRFEGEEPFNQYVSAMMSGKDFSSIPNLSYKREGNVVVNSTRLNMSVNNAVLPDYSLLGNQREEYKTNFKSHIYAKEGYDSFASMESQKGCPKLDSEVHERCSFCARLDKGLERMTAEKFWEYANHISYGKTMIWDFSDSFAAKSNNDEWFKNLVTKQPASINTDFKIFARVDELLDNRVDYLSALNVKEVFIGLESGDQKKLDEVNKGITLNQGINAVRNLKKYGIKAYASFIYGLPGEDSKSLQKTLDFAEEIMSEGDITSIGVRCMFPLAGMKVHNQLIRKISEDNVALADNLRNNDGYESLELQQLWLKYMTNTNIDEITEYHRKLMSIASSYGVRINDDKRLMFF